MTMLLGVDVGTSTTKVVLVEADEAGEVRELSAEVAPTPARAEDLLAAVRTGIRRAAGGAPVAAIGISSMAESGVAADAGGRFLTPILRWDGNRAGEQAAWLDRAVGAADLFAATGVRPSAKIPLATWAWLRAERPQVLAEIGHWLGAADVVAWGMTGEPVTDHTLAGRTGAYLLPAEGTGARGLREGFDPALTDLVGMPAHALPRVAAPDAVAGVLAPGPFSEHLPAGIPVVVAGHDHQVGAWAAGMRAPGHRADSLGTAEAVLSAHARVEDAEAVRRSGMSLVRTIDGAHPVLVAGSASAGATLRRWLDLVVLEDERGRVLADALLDVERHPEPTGAWVAPYLAGRQSPEPDPRAGLGIEPGWWPLERRLRAVVEGIALQGRWMTQAQERLGGTAPLGPTHVLAGERLPGVWRELVRTVTPTATSWTTVGEPVPVGAALLAGVRAGLLPSAPALPAHESAAVAGDPYGPALPAFVAAVTGRED